MTKAELEEKVKFFNDLAYKRGKDLEISERKRQRNHDDLEAARNAIKVLTKEVEQGRRLQKYRDDIAAQLDSLNQAVADLAVVWDTFSQDANEVSTELTRLYHEMHANWVKVQEGTL